MYILSIEALGLLNTTALRRINRHQVCKYAKRHSLVLPKYMRKAAWRLMVKTMSREITRHDAVLPRMRNLIDIMVKVGDLDHNQRIALVLYFKWVGYTVEDVVEFFRRHTKDFKENITRYQVELM